MTSLILSLITLSENFLIIICINPTQITLIRSRRRNTLSDCRSLKPISLICLFISKLFSYPCHHF